MPLDRFLNDEDIEENEEDWLRPSSPAISNFTWEALELDKLVARWANHAPNFKAQDEVYQHPIIPLPGDPDMWAVRVKVRVKSSQYYRH